MAEKRRGKGCFKRKDTWCADCTVCCVYINALLLPLTIFFFCELQTRRQATTTLLSTIPAAPYHYMNSWLFNNTF